MLHTKRYLLLLLTYALSITMITQSKSCTKNVCCLTPSTAAACTITTADYVIIGLGTAGAPLARYLSDNFNNSVVVLEAGQNYNNDPLVQNPSLFAALALGLSPKYSDTYSALGGPVMNFGLAGLLYTEGRLWGGGSGHNGLITVRGSSDIYDEWATITGNSRWLYTNLLPLMKGMEHYTPNNTVADPTQRGLNGALFISQEDFTVISTNALAVQFATTAGAPITPDYNVQSASVATSSNQSYVYPPAGGTPPTTIRSFSSTAFLPTPNSGIPAPYAQKPVLSDAGLGLNGRKLQVVSHATASHILFDQSTTTPTAIGIEYIIGGNKENIRQVYARKKIILCAGAIQNVGILQRSGIGPAGILNPLNIPVIVNNPNVGVNLQNHYGTSAIMQVPTPGPINIVEAFIDCSTAAGGLGANFTPGIRRNQLLFSLSSQLFGSTSVLQALNIDLSDPTAYVSFTPTIIKPNSRGYAQIVDNDPLTDVYVNFNFYSDGDVTVAGSDAQNTVAALRIVEQTATAFGATMIYPTPAQYAAGNAALFEAARNLPFIAYHAAGTCSMGSSISNGVVDGNLQVFGVNNLMCADCSVEPTIETGNTAYAAYVIGIEAARILGATVPTA